MSKDNVNQPDHYNQGGVECIDAITAATVNKTGIEAVCVANVIKYLWRYELKNGLEDVKKAQWYLNKLISELENAHNEPKSESVATIYNSTILPGRAESIIESLRKAAAEQSTRKDRVGY